MLGFLLSDFVIPALQLALGFVPMALVVAAQHVLEPVGPLRHLRLVCPNDKYVNSSGWDAERSARCQPWHLLGYLLVPLAAVVVWIATA